MSRKVLLTAAVFVSTLLFAAAAAYAAVAPTVQTGEPTNLIDGVSVTLNGEVLSNGGAPVLEYGFKWTTDQITWTTYQVGAGDYTGAFSKNLSGISSTTPYYYKAYAINSEGLTGYGAMDLINEEDVYYPGLMPALYSGTVKDLASVPLNSGIVRAYINDYQRTVDSDSAIRSGKYSSLCVLADTTTSYRPVVFKVYIYGIEYPALPTPSQSVIFVNGAVKDVNLIVQTTLPTVPSVQTNAGTDLTSDSVTLSGDITDGGGLPVTEYGFYWGTSSNPATKVVVGTDNLSGPYTYPLSALSPNIYYFKSYATNLVGTGYGEVKSAPVGITRQKGDVNGDENINVQDVVLTVNIILGKVTPTSEQLYAADANSDDVINVQDVVKIVNVILGKA